MKVTNYDRVGKVEIAADGDGLVSRSGTALLAELADRLGLTAALSEAMADTCERGGGHDRGRVLRDLALTLADGGDCLADLGARPARALWPRRLARHRLAGDRCGRRRGSP